MLLTENRIMVILSLVVLGIYGYYYYRQCIKRAKELIRIYLGQEEYERLRKF